jgi:arginase family enzyme
VAPECPTDVESVLENCQVQASRAACISAMPEHSWFVLTLGGDLTVALPMLRAVMALYSSVA